MIIVSVKLTEQTNEKQERKITLNKVIFFFSC